MKKYLLFIILLLMIPANVKAYSTSATSAILMEINSGRILYAKDINNQRSVASISKIMTAILAVESNKMGDVVTIGDEISTAFGSGIYIKKGEEIKLEDLVYGLMLRSGNDAALAIANYVSGDIDSFVRLMNQKAALIGMKNSIFNNPSGLDEKGGNLSTANDMALLMSYAMKNSKFKEITGTKKHKVKTNLNYYDWTNKNKLLNSYKYTTGGKTGFTDIAKRTLVTTASKDGLDLVVVTLNDGNDFADHKSLFEEAYLEYKWYQILKSGYIDIIDEEFYSNRKFYVKQGFEYILNDIEASNIILKIELVKDYAIKNNEKVGTLKIMSNNKTIFTTDIFIELKKKKIKILDIILGWFK